MEKPIVRLCSYDPNWEKQYEYERRRILDVIGNYAVRIEHIGSTAIKGLEAKPIIDIMVGIHDLEIVPNLVRPLSVIEFEYVHKPEFKDRRFFRKGLWGQGTCHLHICKINSKEWKEKILFRDYLRLHPQIAEEYATLKKSLATTYKLDRQAYTKKKEPFIKAIIEKAKLENMINKHY
ncbi:GrpB family protein [Ornithinibacillus sp. L9]|uniref:GrpB family protein n=1 Tax=Ornithinibacillus caprae TaxID=2678566 RepID=A0A6N8FIU6_9BACI|nr:GrpB family protein [Ornithinibacillus caprae]MUK87897.1 GrpB family protein [Ornithinibacillus caprae]